MAAAEARAQAPPRILVTGATGLLGRAVLARLQRDGDFDALGCAFTRAQAPLIRLDLCDEAAVAQAMATLRPALVINVAAERHPDVCERAAAETAALNIEAVWRLARLAEKQDAAFIQISTDYLWRGDSAPYNEDAPTSPPNVYGHQKARAEHAALAGHAAAVVLRVPVLFGPTPDLGESAVSMFAAIVRNSGKAATVDDWQIRVPTYTPDIADTLARMAAALLRGRAPLPLLLPGGIYHYSSADRVTRWGLCQLFAELLGNLPMGHITRLEGPPPGAPRPYDCQLVTAKLEATGLAAPCTPLRDALRAVLAATTAAMPAASASAADSAPVPPPAATPAAGDPSPRRVVWLSGNSGAGKTFTGDALARLAGFVHIDGDALFWSKEPADVALVANFVKAFNSWFEGAPAPPELWHPYMSRQCARVRKELDGGAPRVVISLSVYHREVRDFIRSLLPEHTFVLLRCDSNELVRRARVRFSKFAASRGQTVAATFEESHKMPYSDEAFEQKTRAIMRGLQPLEPDEAGCVELDVSDGQPWPTLFRVLDLGPAPEAVPVGEIADVNYARFRAAAAAAAATKASAAAALPDSERKGGQQA